MHVGEVGPDTFEKGTGIEAKEKRTMCESKIPRTVVKVETD